MPHAAAAGIDMVLQLALPVVSAVLGVVFRVGCQVGEVVCSVLKSMGVWEPLMELITDHRGIFVIIFVLPLSALFDRALELREWLIHHLYSAPELHERRVRDIQQQVRAAVTAGKTGHGPTRLCTARPGWLSVSMNPRSYKKSSANIHINLFDILAIVDPAEQDSQQSQEQECTSFDKPYVWVEPMVSMGQISHFLTPRGWTLPVTPEMDDLTVGGLLMGVGIETSGHKYGLFNELVLEYELVLGDGERVIVTRDNEYADLFHALPWSYGTLGFLASVKLAIIPCKPFVRLRYYPCRKLEKGVEKFRSLTEGEDDAAKPSFVESLAYSIDDMVVMAGDLVDSVPGGATLNEIGRFYKPWFYKHVEGILHSGETMVEEYIPVRDYYHRHTKSIFWELEAIIPIGNHPLFRYTLGWLVPPKVSFLKLTQTDGMQRAYEELHVAQDMLLPMSSLGEHLEVFDKLLGIYPLWLCPHKHYATGNRSFLRDPPTPDAKDESGPYQMYVDIGAYGFPRAVRDKKPFEMTPTMRALEKYVLERDGFQMLYADTFQTKEEFERMFNHSHYKAMRAKYNAESAFGVVYDKMALRHSG